MSIFVGALIVVGGLKAEAAPPEAESAEESAEAEADKGVDLGFVSGAADFWSSSFLEDSVLDKNGKRTKSKCLTGSG